MAGYCSGEAARAQCQRSDSARKGEGAWRPFAEGLARYEFDTAVKAVESNKQALDIGCGHGDKSIDISTSLGM